MLTVTVHWAVFPPSSVVTVITAVPSPLAITFPFPSTVATWLLLDDHVIFLFVAFSGKIVALKILFSPTFKLIFSESKAIPVTFTSCFSITYTSQFAIFPPSSVITVIIALPALLATTLPFSSTVATWELFDFQVTLLFVASSGKIVACNVLSFPTVKLISLASNFTPVTLTILGSSSLKTVTSQVAVFPPSSVVTVITAFPSFLPVIFPFWSTANTSSLFDDHVTFLFVALVGSIVAINILVALTFTVIEFVFKLTSVTATLSELGFWLSATVTWQVAVFPPSSVVTVIVAKPALLATTFPFWSTVAISELLDDHVTFLFVASSGKTVACNVLFVPTFNLIACKSKFTLTTFLSPDSASFVTVTLQETVIPPSSVVAIIFATPSDFPVTLPFSFTIATTGLLDVHITVLFVAFSGTTVATKSLISSIFNSSVCAFNVIPSTPIVPGSICSSFVTVTLQDAYIPLSSVITVTVVVPTAFAVTIPFSSTSAIVLSFVFHITFLFVAFSGITVAFNCIFSLTFKFTDCVLINTPVTVTSSGSGFGSTVSSITVTSHSATFASSSVVTVTIVVPTAFAVTFPASSTPTTE